MIEDFLVNVYERDLSSRKPVLQMNNVILRPNSFSLTAMGGPKEASITAYGKAEALFELLELLRCPITITDRYGELLWWGFIDEVQVRVDVLEVGATLSTLANKTAIEYNAIVPGEQVVGDRYLTDWANHLVSQNAYGIRELVEPLSDTTQEVAEARRAVLLDERALPVPKWYMSGQEGSLSATLLAKGWFSTLDWKYYQNQSGFEAYREAGEGIQHIGELATNEKVAFTFSLGVSVGWYADSCRIRLRKQGAPADNVNVKLYDDNSGVPGTLLATATALASNIPTDYNWVNFEFSSRHFIGVSGQYWIEVSRAGAVDANNYYLIDLNEELGYTRGYFRIWDGDSWEARAPDADAVFEVFGVIETSQQLTTIATSIGQFLTAITSRVNSGVYSCPYRAGDNKGDIEILDLLKAGTSNGRRILATVGPERDIVFSEEPARPTSAPSYYLDTTGRVHNASGTVMPAYKAPVGEWASMIEVLPPSLDTSLLADPTLVFIEEFEFQFEGMKGMLYPRVDPSPWSTGLA